ncbi:hypothetical protein JKP88DRAFT_352578 [Tribonema minus]|uniref:Uncharacterized protein n=1 Tax=Tribonema minus TaxID=303371 RepID=A0A835ZBK8_9STRA|nr:hypothetical protein JKP88DRAFT_352578 [Tribonema minus]
MSDAVLELEEKRKELLLEERFKYREATAAEFGVVHQKALRRTRATFAKQCSVASMRNQDVLRRLKQDVLRRLKPANEDFLARAELKASDKRLLDQRTRFQAVVSSRYPTWHEEQLHKEASRLQELERDKLEVEVRRQSAREAFEREQALRVELERKRHELAAAQIREKLEEQQRRLQRHRLDAESHSLQRALELQAQEESRYVDMEVLRTKTSPLRPRRAVPRGVAFDSEDAAADYYANFDFVKAFNEQMALDAAADYYANFDFVKAFNEQVALDAAADSYANLNFVKAFNEQVALEDSVSAHVKWLDQRYQQNVVAAAATTAAAAAAAAAGQQLHQRSAAAAAAQGSPAEAQQQQQQYHHYQQRQQFPDEAWDSPHSPAPAAPTASGNLNLRQHIGEVQVGDAPVRDRAEHGGRTVSLDVFNANPGITATFAAELREDLSTADAAAALAGLLRDMPATAHAPQRVGEELSTADAAAALAGLLRAVERAAAAQPGGAHPLYASAAQLGDEHVAAALDAQLHGSSAPQGGGADDSRAAAVASAGAVLSLVSALSSELVPRAALVGVVTVERVRREHRKHPPPSPAAALARRAAGAAAATRAAARRRLSAQLLLVAAAAAAARRASAAAGDGRLIMAWTDTIDGAAAAGSAFEALRAHVCSLCCDGLWTADQAAETLAAVLSSAAAGQGGTAEEVEVERAQRKVEGLVRAMAQSEHPAATPAAAVTAAATAASSRRSSTKAPAVSLPGVLSTSLSAMMQEIDEFDDGDGAAVAAAGATLRGGDDNDNF